MSGFDLFCQFETFNSVMSVGCPKLNAKVFAISKEVFRDKSENSELYASSSAVFIISTS